MRNKYSKIHLFFLVIVSFQSPLLARELLVFTTHLAPQSSAYKSTHLLLTEAFNRIGYRFSMRTLPGKRSLHEANKGAFDGEAHRFFGLNDNNDFPNLIRVPEIQQVVGNAMYSKEVTNLTSTWQELDKYRVTVLRGSVWLTAMAKQHAMEVHVLSCPKEMLNFVKQGRADIALMSTETVSLLKSEAFKDSGIKQVGPLLSNLAIYSFMHKKHKDLVPKLALALHQMKLDGSYQTLIKQSKIIPKL